MAEAVTRSLQVPIDAPCMTLLGVMATICARKFAVRLKRDWHEPLNLWTVCVQETGERKSPMLNLMTAPLVEWEQAEGMRLKDQIHDATEAKKILDRRLHIAEEAASKSGSQADFDYCIELNRQAKNTVIPSVPCLMTADVTPESLPRLLVENNGRISIVSPEGEFFGIVTGRYTGGTPNFDVFLKAYSGDDIRVNRKDKAPEYAAKAALSTILAVQPDVLHGLTSAKALKDRGFLGRFLYSIPTSRVGQRDPSASVPIPSMVQSTYHTNCDKLLGIPWCNGNDFEPYIITLDSAAMDRFTAFECNVEKRLKKGMDMSLIPDWSAKFVGQVARLAALLHIMEVGPDRLAQTAATPMSLRTVEAAITLGTYCLEHAKVCYAEMQVYSDSLEDARFVLGWIRTHPKLSREISERDLFMKTKAKMADNMERFKAALAVLVDKGYIRLKPREAGGKPGRPGAPVYQSHPDLFPESSTEPSRVPSMATNA